jgi:DnaD/phage-associated family protein
MANTWIKLYHEILDDPKMGRMSEHLWNFTIKLFLAAGKQEQNGCLPSVPDLAFMMRTNEQDVLMCLGELCDLNIIQIDTDTEQYIVKNFQKRQEVSESTKRWRRWSERQAPTQPQQDTNGTIPFDPTLVKRLTNANPTLNKRQIKIKNKNKKKEEEEEKEEEVEENAQPPPLELDEQAAIAYQTYTREIGALTPMIAEGIDAALKDHPPGWIPAAIQEAAANNARSWKYVEAILKRWQVDGFKVDKRARASPNGAKRLAPANMTDEERKKKYLGWGKT